MQAWNVILVAAFAALLVLLAVIGAMHRDFASLWLAGKAAAFDLSLVYQRDELTEFAKSFPDGEWAAFVYPPFVLFVAVPLALLPVELAYLLWNAAGAALFVYAARPYLPAGLPALTPAVLPASLYCLQFGQYGLFFGAVWLLAFSGKGWAAALLTFKPHLGFLVAPRYLAKPRSLLLPAAVFTGLVLASLAVFGAQAWFDFFGQLSVQANEMQKPNQVGWLTIGMSPGFGYPIWGWACFAVAAAILLARDFNVFTAATATFLISPYGFHYDMSVASLGFVIALFHRPPPWRFAFLFFALIAPMIVRHGGTWLMPPILLAALWAQGSSWRRRGAVGEAESAEAQGAR